MSSNAGSPTSNQSSNFFVGCGIILIIGLVIAFALGFIWKSTPMIYGSIVVFIIMLIVKLYPSDSFCSNSSVDNAGETVKNQAIQSTYRFNHIEEPYFDTVKEYGEKLYLFLSKLRCDSRFREPFEEYSLNGGLQDMVFPDGINTLMMIDLLKIYHQLEYKFGEDPKESFAIVYLFARMNGVASITYQTLPVFYDRLVLIVTKFMPTVEKQNLGDIDINTFFVLGALVQKVDSEMGNQYYLLLYRYASLIVKADGTITPKESELLKSIFSLRKDDSNESKSLSIDTPSNSGMNQLHQLVGLDLVKKEIATLVNFIEIRKMREAKGMKAPDLSYHCVFTGNPGTGKTTVARILANVYRELGLLKSGHLVETDRSGLVAEYVGQTAIKTNKIVDSALDGVLFIDEAYSLVTDAGSDFGKEAISTLLKRMEDDRNRLIVILAGYTDEMKHFIDSNPGLQSRFNRYLEFEDYSEDELLQIFLDNLKRYDYFITNKAEEKLRLLISKAVITKDRNFGNARWVRNIFEKTLETQANRLAAEGNISNEALITITEDDIIAEV